MPFENITKNNVGLGTGVSSLAIILILIGSGNVSGSLVDDVSNDLQDHILEEAHPVAKERLNQILDKVDDVEKELKDYEKQMKLINKELNNLKLIICSNPEFKCVIDLQ